jgi:hypothetical protein
MTQLLYNKKTLKLTKIIIENKTFVFNYSKFFIRDSLNTGDYSLDNYFDIFLNSNKILTSRNIGYSFILNKFLYKHKLYKNLKFYWFNPNTNLQQNLDVLIKSITSKSVIFFIKIIKGGIKCYSSGFLGLLPKEQIKCIFREKQNNTPFLKLSFCINLKNNSKFFYLKWPIKLSKLTVYTTNFNKAHTKSKNINTFNIIYISSQKTLSTPHENNKIKKNNRKYYFRKKN